jgi:hypothetical protein
MRTADCIALVEVGDRAGDAQDLAVRQRREAELLEGSGE